MSTYYNEFDANAAQWLRNLGKAREISQGVVDERSIKELRGADLKGVRRAHFFAGIGGWDLALELAGWGDEEVWTGSCPCQPYSSAGKQKGNADERNLWPDFFRLIAERRPQYVFGEQVASAIKHGWIDRVQADLEGIGYSVGYAVLGAHSVGANHIRQRLYWGAALEPVADGDDIGRRSEHGEAQRARGEVGLRGGAVVGDGGEIDGLVNTPSERQLRGSADASRQPAEVLGAGYQDLSVNPWSDFRLVPCTDGKARRTGARVFPLAYGLPRGVGDGSSWRKGLARSASRARIGMLKGSGNAIVPGLAAEFVRAFVESV